MGLMRLDFILDSFERNRPEGGRGALMVDLIWRIEQALGDRVVWPLRSLNGLVLLARDDWRSPWYVSIEVDSYPFPNIESLATMPSLPEAPAYQIAIHRRSDQFRVFGTARSGQDAVEMVLRAMVESGGWA